MAICFNIIIYSLEILFYGAFSYTNYHKSEC